MYLNIYKVGRFNFKKDIHGKKKEEEETLKYDITFDETLSVGYQTDSKQTVAMFHFPFCLYTASILFYRYTFIAKYFNT